METSKYILRLENEGQIFSTTTLSLPIEFDDFIGKRKVTLIQSHSMTGDDGKRNYIDKLYKTTQGFYIYLYKVSDSNFEITIYYKQEQLNEFDLFIGQLLKQFKNATSNI